MASDGQQQFPPQKQDIQPGKEHVMNPIPQFTNHDYKPSNKLQNCKKVVEEVVNAYGRIDILVNNADEQYKASSVEEIDEERLERVFRTNIFLTSSLLASSIVNTTSINAYKGNDKLLEYTATKGAIVAFTRGLSLQLVNKGIRVNGVAPGPIWTLLIPASFDEEVTAKFGPTSQ
ncbi:hypothetical protein CRYUN_Cryun09bG0184500 [Craigia yunnanensis]